MEENSKSSNSKILIIALTVLLFGLIGYTFYNNNDHKEAVKFLQSEKDGWEISSDDKMKIKRMIIRNESTFKNYGGDTYRLVYLSSLEASRNNLNSISDTFLSSVETNNVSKTKILTFKDVEKGLVTLKENNN